jgi:hypothetical protein
MRRGLLCFVGLLAVAVPGAAYGGLWDNVYRGIGFLATPTGSPLSTTSDGTQVNGSRSGRLRIVPSGIGGGYELQFDRTFGADSHNRPETLHLGGLGDLSLQGTTQATLGYNGRGAFRSFSGTITATNLDYSLRSKIGAQDASLTGQLNVTDVFDINPLGFYDLNLDVANTNATLVVDGVAIRDQQNTNFDIGPIVIRGNIYYDGALALLTSLGVDTTQLESVFPHSPATEIDNAIRDALQQGSVVAGATAEQKTLPMLLQAVAAGDDATAQTLLAELVAESANEQTAQAAPSVVPEPGTLALLALGGSTIWYWRRRG